MIKSFADRETEKIFNREFSRKLPQDIQRRATQHTHKRPVADLLYLAA